MSRGPEATFAAAVHRLLPPKSKLHREKMSNPYSSGTADWWFSGRQDLWAEYKWLVLPKRDNTVIDLINKPGGLSALQDDWLSRRHDEGRNVWVIVGCREGGVIFEHKTWRLPCLTGNFRETVLSRDEIAGRLKEFLL